MSISKIPILDLSHEINEHLHEYEIAIREVLQSGHFILGPKVEEFERNVAQYLGTAHAIGVNSGTDAILLGLRAMGIKEGDEVITSPFTFFATAEPISLLGAKPVFVDIEPETMNMDIAQLETKLTSRTKAIIPVHLFGHAVDMEPLLAFAEAHNLLVLEDVAQAFSGEFCGQKLGTLGSVGAYSFFPSKNLGAFGDGGLVVTNDDEIADSVRMLRAHGSKKKYHNEVLGYNSRLDALQAAVLNVKLPRIDKWSEGRRNAAAVYKELLAGIPEVTTPTEKSYAKHVFHQYTVRVAAGKRDQVRERLAAAGIDTMIYYPVPLHKLPVYADMQETYNCTEQACDEVLSLPIWPQITPDIQKQVAEALAKSLDH